MGGSSGFHIQLYDGSRHDGVTVFPHCRGKSLWWDATCVDTFSEISVIGAVIESGRKAAGAEARKCARYQGLVDRYIFQPVAVETTGVLGPSTLRFLQQLRKRISLQTRDKRETAWLFQQRAQTSQYNCISMLLSLSVVISVDLVN